MRHGSNATMLNGDAMRLPLPESGCWRRLLFPLAMRHALFDILRFRCPAAQGVCSQYALSQLRVITRGVR